jgi:hypothetical protein
MVAFRIKQWGYSKGAGELKKLFSGGIIFLLFASIFSTYVSEIKAYWQEIPALTVSESTKLKIEWMKMYGGKSNDVGRFISSDGKHLYVAGITKSFSAEGLDSLILKLDDKGNILWSRMWGADGDDYVGSMAVTSNSIYLLSGLYWSFMDFLKLNEYGEIIWAKTTTTKGLPTYSSLKVRNSKVFLLASNYWVEFDDSGKDISDNRATIILPSATKGVDMFDGDIYYGGLSSVRFRANGDLVWVYDYIVDPFQTTYHDDCDLIKVTEDGIYITDLVRIYAEGNVYVVIFKLTHNGEVVWARLWDLGLKSVTAFFSPIQPQSMFVTNSNIYVVGDVSVDNRKRDGFILILDKKGNLVGQWIFGGKDNDYFDDIIVLNGDIYVVGDTAGLVLPTGDEFLKEIKGDFKPIALERRKGISWYLNLQVEYGKLELEDSPNKLRFPLVFDKYSGGMDILVLKLKLAEAGPQPKVETKITASVYPFVLIPGVSLTVFGSIKPAAVFPIKIVFTKPDGAVLEEVIQTDSSGNYAFKYKPDKIGLWKVKAVFEGNEKYAPAESDVIQFEVKNEKLSPAGILIDWILDFISLRTEEVNLYFSYYNRKEWTGNMYYFATTGIIKGEKPYYEVDKDGSYIVFFSLWKITKGIKPVLISIPQSFEWYDRNLKNWKVLTVGEPIKVIHTKRPPTIASLTESIDWILYQNGHIPNPVDYFDFLEDKYKEQVSVLEAPFFDKDGKNFYYLLLTESETYFSTTDYFSIIVRPTKIEEGTFNVLIGKTASELTIKSLENLIERLLEEKYEDVLSELGIATQIYGLTKLLINLIDNPEQDHVNVKVGELDVSAYSISEKESKPLKPKESRILPLDLSDVKNPVEITLNWPGSDLDLHLFDDEGKHVGINYETYKVEHQINGVEYSGADSKPEWIKIGKEALGKRYILVIVAKEAPVNGTTYNLEVKITSISSPSAAPLNIELIIIIIVIAATLASLVIVFRKYKAK